MWRVWLRLPWIPAALAASSRATIDPTACVSKCSGGVCLTRARIRLRSCSVNLALHPDSGRMPSDPLGIKARQFPHHAFFLFILRCSRFHMFGHLLAPSSSEHSHLLFYYQ